MLVIKEERTKFIDTKTLSGPYLAALFHNFLRIEIKVFGNQFLTAPPLWQRPELFKQQMDKRR